MFRRSSKGSFSKTENFLDKLQRDNLVVIEETALRSYAERLMSALASATPKDTGRTSASWSYTITTEKDRVKLQVYNDNINDGLSIALLIQYGHATRSGNYVPGVDYINPAAVPIFDKIEESVWREVTT